MLFVCAAAYAGKTEIKKDDKETQEKSKLKRHIGGLRYTTGFEGFSPYYFTSFKSAPSHFEAESHLPVVVGEHEPFSIEKASHFFYPYAYPVHFERSEHVPISVEVPKPYPVHITKHVPIHVPIIVKVPEPYPVHVPQPYPVHVPTHIEVKAPPPVIIKEKEHPKTVVIEHKHVTPPTVVVEHKIVSQTAAEVKPTETIITQDQFFNAGATISKGPALQDNFAKASISDFEGSISLSAGRTNATGALHRDYLPPHK